MHAPTNYLLANMAVSDIIFILLVAICFLSVNLSAGLAEFICKFLVLAEISLTVSSITLTVLAVERCHALLKPFRTGLELKEDNIKEAIAFIWITCVLLCSPAFILKEWSEEHSTCVGPWTSHKNQAAKGYVIISAVLSIYIPLTVIIYCYGSLIR